MFGTLRLILAVMVAVSHVHIRAYGRNPGVVAVVCFFIISGFVMTGVIRSYYQDNKTMFYLDRLMRIYPQYLFFVSLTIIMFWISDTWTLAMAMRDAANDVYFLYNLPGKEIQKYINYLYNFTIVPLNLFRDVGNVNQFIPIAWSLGLEIQFYMILPFILKAFRPHAILYSIFIFSFASYDLINSPRFCYYLLPGTLFIFLSGSLLYDYVHGDKAIWKYIGGLYLYTLILFVTVTMSRKETDPYVIDVFTGYLLGLPLIFLLSSLKRRKFDEFMGNISYGVFLSHFFIIWFFPYYGIFDPNKNIFMFLSCSMLLGFIGYYFVERPVVQWRLRIRKNAIK